MAVVSRFRYLYVVWAFLECLLFGGVMFGWGSFVFVLKKDGVFFDLCSPPTRTAPQANNSRPDNTPTTTLWPSTVTEIGAATVLGGLQPGSEDGFGAVEEAVPSCHAQNQRLALVFALASGVYCLGGAVMGRINFQFGTRVTRICALVLFSAGCLLTGFTTKDRPWMAFPGMALLGIGGIPILITNSQLSLLFSKRGSTIVGILVGAFNTSSGFVPFMIKLAHTNGLSLQWSMVILCGAQLTTLISTFTFLPTSFFHPQEVELPDPPTDQAPGTETEYGAPARGEGTTEGQEGEKKETAGKDAALGEGTTEEQEVEKKETAGKDAALGEGTAKGQEGMRKEAGGKDAGSLTSCLTSTPYLLHLFWFCVLQLRYYFFLGYMNPWLEDLLPTAHEVSEFTDVQLYAMMCSLFISPLVGLVYDLCKHYFADSRCPRRRKLLPPVVPLSLASVLGVLLSGLALGRGRAVLYASFVTLTAFRSAVYGMATAFLIVMFPSRYLGVLYGLLLVAGGIVGQTQYGLYAWIKVSGYTTVTVFLMAAMAVSLVHPAYLWISCVLTRRRQSYQVE